MSKVIAVLMFIILNTSWIAYADPYVLGETAHPVVGNELAYQCFFWVRGNEDVLYYRVHFFNQRGEEVFHSGIGREVESLAQELTDDFQRVYSPRLANYNGQISSCKVETVGWTTGDHTYLEF